ncbi:GAF domain-containing protein [Alphaproteobacteria bacterium KMM 3653]|uniref:GAF domain-containing protein n=1 Tax=Harenicola maris TaxID=2841044 RepID=A0AAP2CQL7_9RHOB|nr:GAF domain-containing protein [Harenicola maris]
METVMEAPTRTFIEVSEVWVPEGDRLVLGSGSYGTLDSFAAASGKESFTKGEGLPGKAWAEGRPVVLKEFDGSYFKRTEAAKEVGLTSAVAIPVFDGKRLKAVLVTLCADDSERMGAIEVWSEKEGLLTLDEGYFGAAKHFEFVSQHTQFPKGQGLPGGVWSAKTPILMRDLGSGYRFVRAESAEKAGLTTGIGLPVPMPGGGHFVVTLLSAKGTPLANRFEIWDARSAKVGTKNEAVLIDGICKRDGALWSDETERRVGAWKGLIGKVLGTGLPVLETGPSPVTANYTSAVALPMYAHGEVSHIVAWYS